MRVSNERNENFLSSPNPVTVLREILITKASWPIPFALANLYNVHDELMAESLTALKKHSILDVAYVPFLNQC